MLMLTLIQISVVNIMHRSSLEFVKMWIAWGVRVQDLCMNPLVFTWCCFSHPGCGEFRAWIEQNWSKKICLYTFFFYYIENQVQYILSKLVLACACVPLWSTKSIFVQCFRCHNEIEVCLPNSCPGAYDCKVTDGLIYCDPLPVVSFTLQFGPSHCNFPSIVSHFHHLISHVRYLQGLATWK